MIDDYLKQKISGLGTKKHEHTARENINDRFRTHFNIQSMKTKYITLIVKCETKLNTPLII